MMSTSYSIPWNDITLFEATFLLSQHKGYIDGDKQTVEVQCTTKTL